MSRSPMTPQRGAELLLEYLDGTLDVDLAQELEAFTGQNQDFRAVVETYKATLRVLKQTMRQEVPADVEERTLNFLRSPPTNAKVG